MPDARPFTPAEEAFFAAGTQELEVSPAESFEDLDVGERKPSLLSRFFARLQAG